MEEPKKKRVVKRTEAQRASENEYHRKKIKTISVNFSPRDYDILEYLDTKESRGGYLKKLLREDMERSASENS